MEPPDVGSSASMALASVVLPLPVDPEHMTVAPGSIAMLMSFRTGELDVVY